MQHQNPIFSNIQALLSAKLQLIEEHFQSDTLVFCGEIVNGLEREFLRNLVDLRHETKRFDKLLIILTTGGGSAEVVERFVQIARYHYQEVNFLVPNCAYSAGTIFCMSGNNIYMDYFSVLGPIDPQVPNKEGKYVPALGYLDKIQELLEKSSNNELTDVEFSIIQNFDLAELRSYEQAREYSVDLLKKWLVQYKFQNWTNHKNGASVTLQEKEQRAEEIADMLSDNNKWKVHGRPIGIKTLTNDLKLKIEDYSQDGHKQSLIRDYHNLMQDFIRTYQIQFFIQSRLTF